MIAPKWTPDDGALHTEQAKPLNSSATVGLLGLSWINEEKDAKMKWFIRWLKRDYIYHL